MIPGAGRSPGEGNGYPLQHSLLENPMDRGVWWAPVHRVTRVRQELVTKLLSQFKGFAGGSDSKESTYNAGELGSVPGLGRSPGEGNGYPLQ